MRWVQGKFAFILDNFDNVEEIMVLSKYNYCDQFKLPFVWALATWGLLCDSVALQYTWNQLTFSPPVLRGGYHIFGMHIYRHAYMDYIFSSFSSSIYETQVWPLIWLSYLVSVVSLDCKFLYHFGRQCFHSKGALFHYNVYTDMA